MDIVKIDATNPKPKIIQKAVDILEKGGVVVYPTGTAYGLGANALSEEAVKKVYEIKGRAFARPTHVVVRDWAMIEELCETNEVAQKLYEVLLPGPLTIILPKKPVVPDALTSKTLGVRVPRNSVTHMLSIFASFPYTTPSANPAKGKTPYSAKDAVSQFGTKEKKMIDLILDAGQLLETPPSTLIDCSLRAGGPMGRWQPKILREGPITRAEIESILKIRVK